MGRLSILNNEIYYKNSTDAGISWSADTRLTINPAFSESPSITVSGQFVHVAWDDYRSVNAEIYYKRSTDGGLSWGADTRLSFAFTDVTKASISVSVSVIHVVWQDFRDGNTEIYYKRSTDAGVSWGADTRLTNNPNNSQSLSIAASASLVHVVWWDDSDGNAEIYYKRSTNIGANWEADTRLTNNPAFSVGSSVSVSGSIVHVVWYDNRDGNAEIYYKRNPTGNLVGIKNINSEIPGVFRLEQNYPNPFNPMTKIKFNIPNRVFVNMVVYDILGREIITLVNEELNPGIFEAEWNASNYPSGVYFYKLEINDPSTSSGRGFTDVKKMVLVK